MRLVLRHGPARHGRLLRAAAECTRGNISILAAASLGAVVAAAALAVDLGSVYLERRTVQGAVDLAAMAAANDLSNADAAARATLSANKVGTLLNLTVTKGRYTANSSMAPNGRFVPNLAPYNAVQVSLTKPAPIYFAKTFAPGPKVIGVGATAATADQAVFSVGSRLASVSDGVPNAILGALLGGNANLKVADYRALVDADIALQGFLDGLATEMHVTGGTYADLLAAHATVGTALRATANAATASNQGSAATAALDLLGQTNASAQSLNLASLVDLGPLGNVAVGETHAGLAAKINAMSLISAAAVLANGSHQVALSLAGQVPGLLALDVDLSVGEPRQSSSWVAVGQVGSELYTAQIRLRLVAEVGGQGVLSAVRVRLPLYLDIASGHARLADVACAPSGASSARATISARPSLLRAWIGEIERRDLADFTGDLTVGSGGIVQAPLMSVSARSAVSMSNSRDTELDFTQSDVDAGTVQTVETHDLVQSLTTSLLDNINLNVQIGGLNIGLLSQSAVTQAVRSIVQSIAAPLDAVVGSLLATLGVHVGEADIQVHGIRCGTAVLAG